MRKLLVTSLICATGFAAAAPPCSSLRLPENWEVISSTYGDVTGDGQPECVLSVWRPWRDWPIARWAAGATPVVHNHDAAGRSSHIAVLKPLSRGKYHEVWVGSALFQPATTISILPSGQLRVTETTYAAGPHAVGQAVSDWAWTGFGFNRVGPRLLTWTLGKG